MNKKRTIIFLSVFALLVISLSTVALAHGGLTNNQLLFRDGFHRSYDMMGESDTFHGYGMYGNTMNNEYHEEMRDIMDEGIYEDFLTFKTENEFPRNSWIDSQEKFDVMQERHTYMQENFDSTDFQEITRSGFQRGFGGCHR